MSRNIDNDFTVLIQIFKGFINFANDTIIVFLWLIIVKDHLLSQCYYTCSML